MKLDTSDFPFHVLPPLLAEIIDELATAYSAPKEILASSAISIIGMCLGKGLGCVPMILNLHMVYYICIWVRCLESASDPSKHL